MKERPILFLGEMVRAILDGRKTQTRRIIANEARGADRVIWIGKDKGRLWPGRKDEPYEGWAAQVDSLNGLHLPLKCPYGVAGDRIWVKETFALHDDRQPPIAYYRADDQTDYESDGAWTPSIFMPRKLSRITLEITKVRVERLQDISREDAKAEGVELPPTELYPDVNTGDKRRECFRRLWDSINGEDAWDGNPWVWVIEFKKI